MEHAALYSGQHMRQVAFGAGASIKDNADGVHGKPEEERERDFPKSYPSI